MLSGVVDALLVMVHGADVPAAVTVGEAPATDTPEVALAVEKALLLESNLVL